jgi:hypothetical protein
VWSPSRSRACRVSVSRVRGGQRTWWCVTEVKGERGHGLAMPCHGMVMLSSIWSSGVADKRWYWC